MGESLLKLDSVFSTADLPELPVMLSLQGPALHLFSSCDFVVFLLGGWYQEWGEGFFSRAAL